VLSALILPITLSLAFGWVFALEKSVTFLVGIWRAKPAWRMASPLPILILFCGILLWRNVPFIDEQVTDERGLEAIAMAAGAPDGSTLMMPWGPLHFAVGYARDIENTLPNITLVDHNADFFVPFLSFKLVVPEYLQYSPDYGLPWWEEQLNANIFPRTAAPSLVALMPEPENVTPPPAILTAEHNLTCTDDTLTLHVIWTAPDSELPNLTAFVHLLDENGVLIAQDDHPPAYGWNPSSEWQAGEVVRELHMLPKLENGQSLRYGLYYQAEDGAFINEYEQEIPVVCDE
jgi:hypothetical protein